jgi:N-acetylmuramoyl-L-alanine amidase
MPGTLNWLRNPAAKASAHYLVTKLGAVYQLVKDEDTAWHVGIVNKPDWVLYKGNNPNNYTLGIEHEALAGEGLSEPQYQASLELHRELVAQYNIPIDRNHIIGHYRLDSVNRRNDPGPGFPWDRLFADLTRPAGRSNLLDISIEVENKKIKGFLQEDTTYAPVREIASALGWKVEWLNQSQRVLLLPPAEKNESQKNGVSVVIASQILDAIIEGDQAFAPVRKLAESMGYQVEWDNNTRTTKIRKA